MCKGLKKNFILFCIVLGLYKNFAEANDFFFSLTPKKYSLSICAIFKDEAKYLKEWIEYHRIVGVDHFYLYNIGSEDRYVKVLNPYVKEGVVTLINWKDHIGDQEESRTFMWALGTQIPAYENALKLRAANETKWLVFLDVNEFLVPPMANSLIDILEKYDEYPGVTLECDFFDASKEDVFSKRRLVIETLKLVKSPELNPEKGVSKTIFKPELCKGFTWPPYKCLFAGVETDVAVDKNELRINYYANREVGVFYRKSKQSFDVDNRLLSHAQTAVLLQEGYEIEDQERAIYRFLPMLLTKMGYDSGWWGW